jgi:hypothetical protein
MSSGTHLEKGGVLGQAGALEKGDRLEAAQHAVAVEVCRRKPLVVHLQLPTALRHGCLVLQEAALRGQAAAGGRSGRGREP